MNRAIIFIIGLLVFTSQAMAGFERIDYPGAYSTYVTGIDDDGTVVGNTSTFGFTYKDGVFTKISCPQVPENMAIRDGLIVGFIRGYTSVRIVNGVCITGEDTNVVWSDHVGGSPVGWHVTPGPLQNPVSFDQNGNTVSIPNFSKIQVNGANRHGALGGHGNERYAYRTGVYRTRTVGFTRTPDGVVEKQPCWVADINDNGDLLCSGPERMKLNGVWSEISLPVQNWGRWYYELNNSGQVAGTFKNSATEYRYSGFVYTAD